MLDHPQTTLAAYAYACMLKQPQTTPDACRKRDLAAAPLLDMQSSCSRSHRRAAAQGERIKQMPAGDSVLQACCAR
jgi:hypothetical protein